MDHVKLLGYLWLLVSASPCAALLVAVLLQCGKDPKQPPRTPFRR